MFTHSKKHKTLRQSFVWVLSLAMICSNLTTFPVQASTVSGGDAVSATVSDGNGGTVSDSEAGGVMLLSTGGSDNVRIFDAGDLATAAKGTYADEDIVESGDFTLLCHKNTAVEEKATTFDDDYTSTKRISLGGTMTTTKAGIKFTTTAPAEVTVYWVCGGDGREIKIIDEAGTEKAITSESPVKNDVLVSTLSLEEAGTYILGSSSSSNYIFRIVVEEEVQETVNGMVFDAGDLDTAAKGTYADGDTVESGDFTLLCHKNTAVEEKATTFDDDYTSTKRVSLGGTMTTEKAGIKFTTTAAAEVTVYWVCGGDGREIKIIDEAGTEKAITSESPVKNDVIVSTLSLEEAGTYILGSASSSNYIFRIVVEEQVVEEMIFDAGDLTTAAKGTYADEDIVESGDFTLLCHKNTAVEEKATTFDDDYTSTKRVSLGGTMTTTKAGIKFTTTGSAEVTVYWVCGGDGREIKIIDEAGTEKAITSESPVKNDVIVSTLSLEAAGTYILGSSNSSNYIFRIVVKQAGGSNDPVVKTVTAVQDAENEASVTISFTGTAGDANTKYTVLASKDGENWVKVETVDGTQTEGTVTVDLTSEDFGYGTWQFSVEAGNTVVATEKVEYLADTYTLSGTYTGLANAADLEDITFTAVTDSMYVVPKAVLDAANGTYSVVLEKGTTYTMAAVGVDDYAIKGQTDEGITYSADTTLNLEFEKKPVYPITISLGSTPDLSGKKLEYTFTHSDGNVYKFSDASGIELRDGYYKVALGGDIEQMAYGINAGDTLTVNGAAVNHAITFRALTSWNFGADYTSHIEGNTGWYKGLYIDATSGKLAPHSSGTAQFNAGTVITVPVSGPCKISVTAYEGQYALYTINGTAAGTDSATTEVEYTGEAGTIDVVSTGTSYIASITLTYPTKDVESVDQSVMPFVPENDTDANTAADTDGIPRRNNKDSITVQPVGQKLNLSQTGGDFNDAFAKTDNVSYYLFPMTADHNKLEFDLVVTESKATGNGAGFFAGVFTDNYVYSLGLRAGGQKIRGIYSKNGGLSGGSFAGAGSPTEEMLGLNRPIHYTIEWNETTKKPEVTITFLDDAGVEQTRSWSQSPLDEPDGSTPTKFYYGFALANISATITNMVYTDKDGKVLYNQNDCYYPEGALPVASSVTAATDERTYIDVNWTGTVPEGDGTYVVQMKLNDGEWRELASDITAFTYRYSIPAGEEGDFTFRVCGQLGKEGLGGERNSFVAMEGTIWAKGALAIPVVDITAAQVADDTAKGDITLSWAAIKDAEYYQVFRYSSDEGADNAKCIAERLTETSYVDSVEVDMPYYYYVKAVSEATDNASPYSATVWAMVTTARDNGYVVYGAETEDIFLTKKSYDTVFTNKATVEGKVYEAGTLQVLVNGTKVQEKTVAQGDTFAYELELVAGRNDVELLLVKSAETTRRALNFVYLTNYDMVVDAAYEGTDGAANENGIPTYKTVQAAVNAVPADNADSKVILVMAGEYEERLEVSTPYISLIGEDRENTLIHCYPADIPGLSDEDKTKSEAGGDMEKRCATYIKSSAKNFSAENISFANDYVYGTADGKSNKSADAVRVDADNASFVNVHFIGVQDTLYMDKGYQYYEKCLIEGLVDFVYSGESARSVFNDCELRFVYESTKTSGYVSAPKTDASAEYGLIFMNCAITAEEGCAGNGYLLARPWGADAYITWINTYMGKVVNELEPYGDMSGNMHEDARFFEYGTFGPGFAVNADRRQISATAADTFIAKKDTGITNADEISAKHYVGTIVTDADEKIEVTEPNDDKYLWSDGDDTGLGMYDLEGYASYYEVTGGGLLKETNDNYYQVATAEEFLDALLASKESGKDSVIELTADINLGCNEIENFSNYSSIIKKYSAQALTHPTLIESGVSQVTFDKVYNLTIFSLNGASIKHANITMKNSENIIIRNIKFDELWEWDEATEGDYDRNDWDYMTVDSTCDGIWIDHCTFYKAYDGIIDVKNPAPTVNITISWCEFLPGSENNEFFDVMMDDIFANPSKYPTYQHMLEEGMTEEQVYMYAYGQKKTHLFGQDDTAVNAAGIRATLANNYYKDTMDRLPRLRYGYSHVYNCIMDAQNLLDVRLSISNEEIAKKIVSNGAASTCGAKVLLENCYISGIQNAMNSGNGSSPSGYINAINSAYYMDGIATELAPKVNTTKEGEPLLITDAEAFIAELPYSDYQLYDAEDLHGIVIPNAGAGKLDLTVLQWEKASYNVEEVTEEEPEVEEAPINKAVVSEKDTLPESVLEAVKDVTGCDTVEELVVYLKTAVTTMEEAAAVLSGVDAEDTAVVDIKVMISYDGINWDLATPANFPEGGVDVIISYGDISDEEELNKDDYNYVIGHMITNGEKAGTMEFPAVVKTTEGIKVHISSASPFVIGWKAVEKTTVPTPAPTATPSAGGTTTPSTEATPAPTLAPVTTGQSTSPKTYDDSVWFEPELLPEKLPVQSADDTEEEAPEASGAADAVDVPVLVGVDAVDSAVNGEGAMWLVIIAIMGVFGIGLGITARRYLKREEE